MRLSDRIARLEAIYRPTRSSPLTTHSLERMTMAELDEMASLLRVHGDVDVDDLPDEPRARAMALIDAASLRTQPAPPARMEPGYDVMAAIRRLYDAARARAVQSANPATAGVAGLAD